MTASALFSGTTAPTPAEINERFAGLVSKGLYSGGLVSATGTNNNVTVEPYVAMASFGMLVKDTAATVVALSPAPSASAQYVYIHAIYSPSGPATVSLLKTNTVQVDTATESYICVCVVKPYASGFVNNDLITYDIVGAAGRDQVTPVRDTKYLGYFTTKAARDVAFPAYVPGTVAVPRVGDTTTYGTTGTNYVVSFWDGLIWQDQENAGAVKTLFSAHAADMVMHTTADQHAALAGTAGTPSSANKYVTQDDPGILPIDQYKALEFALGSSPLSQANPVVAQNLLIAVPRVFQVAVASTTSKILLTAAALGRTDFVAYLGKQGNNGQSSAVQYFAIEDDYGNGYISTVSGLPVYVTDVLDHTGTVQLNPGSDSQVDNHGFYDAEANDGLVLQLSSDVAIGTRLYVRMNIKGDLSALTPNWPGSGGSSFLPAITAFRNGKESYTSSLLGDFHTLVVGASSSGTVPNTQISTRQAGSGIAPLVTYAFREGATVRATLNVQTSTTTGPNAADAGTMKLWTPSLNISNGVDEDAPGVLINNNGIQSYNGLFVTNAGLDKLGGIDGYGRVMAAQGNAAAPGIYFANELGADETTPSTATGVYYRPAYNVPDSSGYGFDLHNGIGFSILGKTALYVARTSATTPITDMDCPLMILQDYEAGAGKMNYFIGINNEIGSAADPEPGVLAFGSWSSLATFAPALVLDIYSDMMSTPFALTMTKKQIFGNVTLQTYDEAHPAYAFQYADSTGMFYVDSWTNSSDSITFGKGIGFSINAHAALVITQDIDSATHPITGALSNPLILNQRNDGVEMSYDFAISDAEDGGLSNGSIRFGKIGYTGAYVPMLTVNAANSTVNVLVGARFSGTLTVQSNLQLTNTHLYFMDAGQGVLSTGASVILGNQTGAYVEVLNSAAALSLVGDTTVRGTSTIGTLNVVGVSGNAAQTGTLQASSAGLLLGYGTSPSSTQKIYWGANNPAANAPIAYLSTNGKIFAAVQNDAITYGFAGYDTLGIGIYNSALKLFGNVYASNMSLSAALSASSVSTQVLQTIVVETATVTATGNVTANGAFVGPTITNINNQIAAIQSSAAGMVLNSPIIAASPTYLAGAIGITGGSNLTYASASSLGIARIGMHVWQMKVDIRIPSTAIVSALVPMSWWFAFDPAMMSDGVLHDFWSVIGAGDVWIGNASFLRADGSSVSSVIYMRKYISGGESGIKFYTLSGLTWDTNLKPAQLSLSLTGIFQM